MHEKVVMLLQEMLQLTELTERTATHCNALQRTATHCNTLQLTATHCTKLQHTATNR